MKKVNMSSSENNKGAAIVFEKIVPTRKKTIHTTLKQSDIAKLKDYGDGKLNTGIEKVLEIAESKQYNVKEQLIRIASKIMNEEEIMMNG
jgi:hypothetical protein